MGDNEEENLNIQFPVDEDRNVANYHTQATFQADPSYINVDWTAPINVRELQQSAFHVIQIHARNRGRIEEVRIMITRHLNGQPISENHLPHWTAALEEFVQKLLAFTNQEVQTDLIRAELESLGVTIDKILMHCVKCFLTLESYKKKRNFFRGLFHEDFIKRLKNAYIREEFRDRVTTIRSDVVKEDGTTLTEEERATVSQFLQKILSEVTITIWLELDQLLPLLDDQQDSVEPSDITITIDLTRKPKEIKPPTLDAVKEMLSKAISNGNETISKQFAYLIDPVSSGSRVKASADFQVPTGDHQVLSEGQQPVTSEEIIRHVVGKLLEKYDEGAGVAGVTGVAGVAIRAVNVLVATGGTAAGGIAAGITAAGGIAAGTAAGTAATHRNTTGIIFVTLLIVLLIVMLMVLLMKQRLSIITRRKKYQNNEFVVFL